MRAFRIVLAGVAALALVGCGGGGKTGSKVEGKVVKGGAPFAIGDSETLTITLTSDDGKKFSTSPGADGTFSVQDPAGGPIPPGKYKVGFVHQRTADPYTKKAAFNVSKDNVDTWDLTSSNTSLVLDIGK